MFSGHAETACLQHAGASASPHRKSDGQSEQVTQTVTSGTQVVTRSAQIGAASPRTPVTCGPESAPPLQRGKPDLTTLTTLQSGRN
ncbi:hypothetical protein SAM23877_7622 [Streptomyces ambofaciens ATCC 23877]|uniref:Uncharacterized protein n=1 Tax=Streptomyces ambofaciens (strain ATCC 23877 / 3486 / DSM 40053 / JCM 4204 / NBRC 12836 / NRRL B-2516) TaxID=278992 RepID=A0A0K2AJL9_STRA7|nr:hypothetical protein SAM23877_0047 [Streptomyces ambofaciens ATCC 23877]AKZ60663.1 hypothetical protein SAM23877_7622 [Streptomyces ambofaciens ATCC 23877]